MLQLPDSPVISLRTGQANGHTGKGRRPGSYKDRVTGEILGMGIPQMSLETMWVTQYFIPSLCHIEHRVYCYNFIQLENISFLNME